ncbi:28905_t:CDS:2, partial [Gigaspora margarita]
LVLLLISTELLQSYNEQLDIRNCYETSDDYETTDDEYSSNKLVVSEEHALKKKQNREMNSKTILKKIRITPYILFLLISDVYLISFELLASRVGQSSRCTQSFGAIIKCTKNKEFQDLKNFFLVSNPQDKLLYNKRYPCSGLCKEKHFKYIEWVGSFITFGRAPPIYKVLQELFPLKFTNETKFSYSKLLSDQSRRLNDKLLARSK